ncbi:hypothetical protein G3I13_06995 [Streptomyces sp. SID6673]|nr:hypothetical protein [Streptomyces sp. SID6673]
MAEHQGDSRFTGAVGDRGRCTRWEARLRGASGCRDRDDVFGPGYGTAAGLVAGGVASYLTSKGVDWLWD